MPTDPIDAVLRRSADSDNIGGDEIIAALRDAVVEIGCDNQNELVVGPAPDGVLCVAVVTAAVHKHHAEADRWWPVLGTTLPGSCPPTPISCLIRAVTPNSGYGPAVSAQPNEARGSVGPNDRAI
ncbi:hypothetical protein [Nocardia gamkensis]|uniref:hypothetical protein n=1 Tax=Nocardia gamkensis TaxID=352869 RepID=UPI0037CAD219